MSDALNNKDYKFEDGKLYARVGSNMIPNREEQWFSMDEILTKKDVIKLIDIFGAFISTSFQHRGDIGASNVEYFNKQLVTLREGLNK